MFKIINGFPGVGKSYLTDKLKDLASDSDSSKWNKLGNWPYNYLDELVKQQQAWKIVFASTHKELLQEQMYRESDFVVVYPDRSLKNQYMDRYIERGSSALLIAILYKNWDTFIGDIENNIPASNLIKLQRNENLSDVITTIIPKEFHDAILINL
jgi:hypothetical protein